MALWRRVAGPPVRERHRDEPSPPVVPAAGTPTAPESEAVHEPAKVLRIAGMVTRLLAEVRDAPLDEAGRRRLREIHDESITELASVLSPDLAGEVSRMSLPLDGAVPSGAELRVAQAQLAGWLQGLIHGIQAAILVQQVDAQEELARLRRPGGDPGIPSPVERPPSPYPGAYL